MKEEILKYEVGKYNFRKLVSELYAPDLEYLHYDVEEPMEIMDVGKDSDTIQHRKFYDKIREGWQILQGVYKLFIKEEIFPIIGGDRLVYQKLPTYRIHFPKNKVISEWHCDGQDGYNHPKGEVNFLLPLTLANDSNTIWVESAPGLKDFHPVNMKYGDYLMFNGNECVHGNQVNNTGQTRVSFDFRVIPFDEYDENYTSETATTGMKFKLGEYFDIMKR